MFPSLWHQNRICCAKLSHDAALGPTNLPQSLQDTKLIGRPEAEHACLKFPVRGFPSPKKVHFRFESISVPFYILGAKLFPERCYVGDISKLCWIWHLGHLGKWQPSAISVALWRCSCLKSPTFSRTNFTTPKSIQIWRAKAGQRIVGTCLFFFGESLHIMLFIRWIEDEHR